MKTIMKVSASALVAGAAFGFGASVLAAPPVDWSGPYVGIQAGYGWGDADHAYTLGAPGGTSSLGGALIGGHLGWLNQTPGGFVWGIEIDGEWSSVDGSYDEPSGATSAGSADIDWDGSARARLGLATGNVLLYATGGGALARINATGGPSPSCACGPISPVPSSTQFGWTAGGGVEVKTHGSWSIGVEYRYSDYGSFTGEVMAFPGVDMSVDTKTHAIRGRVGFHF